MKICYLNMFYWSDIMVKTNLNRNGRLYLAYSFEHKEESSKNAAIKKFIVDSSLYQTLKETI